VKYVLILSVIVTLSGCNLNQSGPVKETPEEGSPKVSARIASLRLERSIGRYQIQAAGGKIVRLDTATGETALVTDDGMKTLKSDRPTELRIGEKYKLTDDKIGVYEGGQKFKIEEWKIEEVTK
jgi:hypothetical protein